VAEASSVLSEEAQHCCVAQDARSGSRQ